LDKGGKSEAAMFSVTCAGRFAPGIAQVTAGNSRIQRKANWASDAPDGTSFFNCSTALRPVSKSMPEKVSPWSNAQPAAEARQVIRDCRIGIEFDDDRKQQVSRLGGAVKFVETYCPVNPAKASIRGALGKGRGDIQAGVPLIQLGD
jgi:hypothetical protein